jgi:hypothetical protein
MNLKWTHLTPRAKAEFSSRLCLAINIISSLERTRTITALSKMNAHFTFDLPDLNIVWTEPEPVARVVESVNLPINPKFLSTFKSVAAAAVARTTTVDISTSTSPQEAPLRVKKSLVFKYQLTPVASNKLSRMDVELEARRVLFGDDDDEV